jgi:hypothetical protein
MSIDTDIAPDFRRDHVARDAPFPAPPQVKVRGLHYTKPASKAHSHRKVVLAAVSVIVCWLAAVVVGVSVHPSRLERRSALFVHLASLLFGFGAVGIIDLHGLLWMAGRRRFGEVTRLVQAVEPIIWAALAGLLVSGSLLEPHPGVPLTRIKLALVLVIGLNGAIAQGLHAATRRLPQDMTFASCPRRYRTSVLASATVSQIGWWGAILIGFLNTTSRVH